MGKRQLLNVLPNFAGVGAGLIFPLLFNIAYYRLLGTEGYGLIGFYGLLAIIASLVDLGLSQTTLREVARRASDHEHARELPSLVLTLALISCALGSLVGLSAVASSKWLATSWLDLSRLSVEEVAVAIATMGGIAALVFPANILNATLRGLQRQVLFNTFAIVAGACRGVVTIAALHVFGLTPLVFFSAQLLISACEVMVLAVIVGVLLPHSRARLRFDFRLFQASWRFTFTVCLSIVIGQIILLSDKVVMSVVLPLDLFGLYSIAFTVASTVQRLATPFSNAYLPHFVELFEKRSVDLLSQAYHLASRLASAVVICAGLLLLIYA
jgi:O-antigen/teichoic acid export membrane protein